MVEVYSHFSYGAKEFLLVGTRNIVIEQGSKICNIIHIIILVKYLLHVFFYVVENVLGFLNI